MGIEIKDRRAEKAAAEANAPAAVLPTKSETLEAFLTREDGQTIEQTIAKQCTSVVEFKKTVPGEVQQFKSVGYTLVYIGVNGQQMLAGRGVGLRTDEKVFTADWLFPPVWDEGLNWQGEVKKRLLTFKSCSCDRTGFCAFHAEACPGRMSPGKWMEEDMRRLKKVSETPLCEALEILMKAEMARQGQRIVAPGQR